MGLVRALAPWIVYGIAGAFLADRYAALAALVVAVVLVVVGRAQGRGAAYLLLELSSMVFFAIYTTLDFVVGGHVISDWSAAASQVWLFATMGLTLLIGKPFTTPFAQLQTPPEVWSTQQFADINRKITQVWTLSFFISSVLLIILTAAGIHPIWVILVIFALAIIIPASYTKRQQEPTTPVAGNQS